jgi:hypothetical protein
LITRFLWLDWCNRLLFETFLETNSEEFNWKAETVCYGLKNFIRIKGVENWDDKLLFLEDFDELSLDVEVLLFCLVIIFLAVGRVA